MTKYKISGAWKDAKWNEVITWIWNYSKSTWEIGKKVEVINGTNGKYLIPNPDNKLTDNLEHLTNFDWIAP